MPVDLEQNKPEEKKEDKDPNNTKLPKHLQIVLKELVKKYEKEDDWVRKQQIKMWKKNDEFWHGVQFIFWSESNQEWISPNNFQFFQGEEGRENAEGPFYDFVVNIYKAHGEAIIAALSAQTPGVRFPPDDADDEDDLLTAKTYNKIAQLIMRHNPAKLLLLNALFILWNQSIVCAYHAPKADKAFGKYMIPQYERSVYCEQCEKNIVADENETDLSIGQPCPDCKTPLTEGHVINGFHESPKSRVLIELYGGLHVKVAYYAREQKDSPYIICSLDQPLAFLKSIFEDQADDIEEADDEAGQTERIARTPSSYTSFSRIDDNKNLRTFKRCWLRPWVFDGLDKNKDKEKKELKKLFPNGCYVGFVGDIYVESRDEDCDKHWTIGKAGLSQYIHAEAIGQPLIPIQEITNVHVNITQETIEHGIPSGFADPDVLNFKVYSAHEAKPGMIYPAKPRPGQNLANSFYEQGRATLSQEVEKFGNKLEELGQFVVGSFPSIYGGPTKGKSKTAAEYNMSRQQALQRLQIAWALIVHWWTKMIEKCVHLFVDAMTEDERFTMSENNNYVNVWIRRSEITGHVGEVEPEGTENFPVSTQQQQQNLLNILQMKDEVLNSVIYNSENRRKIAAIFGHADLYIPGEDQRSKQIFEIRQMIKTKQLISPLPMVDDDMIHMTTCQSFLASAEGIDLQMTNPQAFETIQQHLALHAGIIESKTIQQHGKDAPGVPPNPQEAVT